MLQGHVIVLVAFAYLGLLFGIAYYADNRADAGRSVIDNPTIYALSLAVYATAWTFYGSVGRAASDGIGFLPIYLGPTLMIALWWLVMRKIIRISKNNRITSLADFIASRYGKSALLGGLVTVIAVIGILPYISLQLKAISASYAILLHYPEIMLPSPRVGRPQARQCPPTRCAILAASPSCARAPGRPRALQRAYRHDRSNPGHASLSASGFGRRQNPALAWATSSRARARRRILRRCSRRSKASQAATRAGSG